MLAEILRTKDKNPMVRHQLLNNGHGQRRATHTQLLCASSQCLSRTSKIGEDREEQKSPHDFNFSKVTAEMELGLVDWYDNKFTCVILHALG